MALSNVDVIELDQHVKLLGWIHIVGELISVVIGVLVWVFFIGIGTASGDPQAVTVLGVIGTVACGFIFVLALPGIIAGIGLLKRKTWARYLALIVGSFDLLLFPIGTIIGLYTLWVLLQESAAAYFAEGGRLADDSFVD